MRAPIIIGLPSVPEYTVAPWDFMGLVGFAVLEDGKFLTWSPDWGSAMFLAQAAQEKRERVLAWQWPVPVSLREN